MNIKKCPKCSSKKIKKIENAIENKDFFANNVDIVGK
jgi:hypothetical protein